VKARSVCGGREWTPNSYGRCRSGLISDLYGRGSSGVSSACFRGTEGRTFYILRWRGSSTRAPLSRQRLESNTPAGLFAASWYWIRKLQGGAFYAGDLRVGSFRLPSKSLHLCALDGPPDAIRDGLSTIFYAGRLRERRILRDLPRAEEAAPSNLEAFSIAS